MISERVPLCPCLSVCLFCMVLCLPMSNSPKNMTLPNTILLSQTIDRLLFPPVQTQPSYPHQGYSSSPSPSSGSYGLEVSAIEGPSVVVNGSKKELVLDCKYQLTDHDKSSLVVKWYFKRKPYPVYQWIPNNVPQVSEKRQVDM